tara:strand:- start:39 stop:215 length:177 start_codon:yes stop_codon:yes gene_type:complete
VIGFISNIGLLPPNRFDLQKGEIEILDICAGIAIADPELMKLLAFFFGCSDVLPKTGE